MTYEKLVSINEEHKKDCKDYLRNIEPDKHDIAKDWFGYRLSYENRRWMARNNTRKTGIRVVEKGFNDIEEINTFYELNRFVYITNISVLNTNTYKHVLDKYDFYEDDIDKFLDLLKRQENVNDCVFKRVPELNKEVSKLILKGGTILLNIANCINVVRVNNDLYVLSDVFIGFDNLKELRFFSNLPFKRLYVDNLDISKVQSLTGWFSNCSKLEEIYLKNFDTSRVIKMDYMFNFCFKLRKVNLDILNTKNVIYMDNMFSGCESIRKLDLSSFDTRKLYSIEYMFKNCTNLEEIDISNWKVDNIYNGRLFLYKCNALKEIKGIDNLYNNMKVSLYTGGAGTCPYLQKYLSEKTK